MRCVDQEREKENAEEKVAPPPVLVKGYMRPNGTSYYVVIPKEIRAVPNLKGGEYFIMKAMLEIGMVKLNMVYFSDEEGGRNDRRAVLGLMGCAAAYEVHKHTRGEQPRPSSSYAFRRAHKKGITKNGGIAAVIGDCSGGVTWLRRMCNVSR